MYTKPLLHTTDPYRRDDLLTKSTRSIYYGEVVSIEDDLDGARIKARIIGLDDQTSNNKLSWAYPMLPRFFHLYPKVGELVRIFIEDVKYPKKNRFWIGSVISQPQKIAYDSFFSVYSTSSSAFVSAEPAPEAFPASKGVFPDKEDVAILGRVNTDVILKNNELQFRAGKHEDGNILKLNTKNPASINLLYEESTTDEVFRSNTIVMSDKIALISHSGIPSFKSQGLTKEDREKLFETAHPIARGDTLVDILSIFRDAMISHIHGYSSLPADKTAILKDLEKINLESILQKNIVIN
jgi:hypothetical protein